HVEEQIPADWIGHGGDYADPRAIGKRNGPIAASRRLHFACAALFFWGQEVLPCNELSSDLPVRSRFW
ncbi:MAG: hypothetical protein AAF568_11845, partial [Pseudomonadota bacterium]